MTYRCCLAARRSRDLSLEQLQAQLELKEAEEERGRDDLLRPSSVPSWLTDDLATSTTNKAPPLQSLPARASASGNEPRGTRGVGVPLIGSGGSGPVAERQRSGDRGTASSSVEQRQRAERDISLRMNIADEAPPLRPRAPISAVAPSSTVSSSSSAAASAASSKKKKDRGRARPRSWQQQRRGGVRHAAPRRQPPFAPSPRWRR